MKKLLLLTLCLIFAVAGPCLTVSAAEYPIQKEIDYVKNPVVLDGEITEKEWGKPIFGGDPTKTGGFSVPDGLDTSLIPKNIEVYVCWDNDNFYVGAVVEYKSFWNGHKHQDIWMGDSLNVDVCVAEDNQDSRWRTVNGYSHTEGRGFSYITAEPDAHQLQYEWATIERADSFLGKAEIAKNGNTVVYECTFPWSYYGNNHKIANGHTLAACISFFLANGIDSGIPENGTFLGSVSLGKRIEGKLSYPRFVLTGGPKGLQDDVPEEEKAPPKEPFSLSSEVIIYIASGVILLAAISLVIAAIVIKTKKNK